MSRVVLLTGASRGIGQSILLCLGRLGYTVLGTATTEAGAARITDQLQAQGISGRGYVLVLGDAAESSAPRPYESFIEVLSQDWGGIDCLVHNAALTKDALSLRMPTQAWDTVIATNLSAVFQLTQACLRGMIRKAWGRIVSIGSVVGFTGNPGQVNYAAAKAGLIGLTKSLALELAKKAITVNLVAPGFIETDMTAVLTQEQQASILAKIPMARMGKPDDVAELVAFLLSDAAGYITGQSMHVNGGMYMA